ncbi:transposase [Streptomyces sp. NPDC018026]|uniref:transposase n=1 Tax=Streptomyces sp. NPDC018026 TaxID=3365031 RepID=UPI003790EEB1
MLQGRGCVGGHLGDARSSGFGQSSEPTTWGNCRRPKGLWDIRQWRSPGRSTPPASASLSSRRRRERHSSHPDADIITRFPGLSVLPGARVLAEIGGDRERFADARAMKAYAGAAPVTRASARSHVVVARTVNNQRLASAGHMWAFTALWTQAPRAHYDRRRAGGERYTAALRNLFNKLLGCLYHCLRNRMPYDVERAFTAPVALAA